MAEAEELLDRLARAAGIASEYHDIWRKPRRTSPETQRALLRAMGFRVDTASDLRAELDAWEARNGQRLLEPVLVVRPPHDAITVPFNIAADRLSVPLVATVHLEDGTRHEQPVVPRDSVFDGSHGHAEQSWVRCKLTLETKPALGYHRLTLTERGQAASVPPLLLVVAPARCHLPDALARGRRSWGPALQLYGLRSSRNWGIGDLGDLERLTAVVGELGAGIVGLNPLHALFPGDPAHASPYSPSSRMFSNPLYLDVEAIPELAAPDVRQLVDDPAFQASLRAARQSELVDYAAVARLKGEALERCYAEFRRAELEPLGARGREFHAFVKAGGEKLREYGRFEALAERFPNRRWPDWPMPFRRPDSPDVAAFAETAVARVEFHQWLQWHLERQWARASAVARGSKLEVGLYCDLAVSVDRSGFDSWRRQEVYASGASYGAPPDDFAPQGQDWGLPPWIPERLREARYEPFIEVVRANMQHAGALRIDHVMGLMRAFWVPAGGTPAEGAYVHYPFQDLLGILALESHTGRCLVVGEDLGTVPEEVPTALAAAGVLSYRPLYFMKHEHGEFVAPADYPAQALVTVTTHDLPTLHGYWSGRDVALRAELGFTAPEQDGEPATTRRTREKFSLLRALEREGLLPEGMRVDPLHLPEMSLALAQAIHRYVARTPAQVMTFQIEDVLGQLEQANVPGTTGEHPNWQRKLATDFEDWSGDPGYIAFCRVLARA